MCSEFAFRTSKCFYWKGNPSSFIYFLFIYWYLLLVSVDLWHVTTEGEYGSAFQAGGGFGVSTVTEGLGDTVLSQAACLERLELKCKWNAKLPLWRQTCCFSFFVPLCLFNLTSGALGNQPTGLHNLTVLAKCVWEREKQKEEIEILVPTRRNWALLSM